MMDIIGAILRATSRTAAVIGVTAVLLGVPFAAGAADARIEDARSALAKVYGTRGDLRQFFDPYDWSAVDCPQTKGITDLEDWARKYGYVEYPVELHWYAPYSAAADEDPLSVARARLARIFSKRLDLQQFFSSSDWTAVPARQTSGITDLEDWARKYGYVEHPVELGWFAPFTERVAEYSDPPALRVNEMARSPVKWGAGTFDTSTVTASSIFVVDAASREVLLSRNADRLHPMASITKLMTAMLVTDMGIPMQKVMTMRSGDEVGGARLRVPVGTEITVENLLYAMLVGSANNSAYALQRSSGLPFEDFISRMNAKAAALGLRNTRFADPSGLEVENISTAKEIAALAIEAFEYHDIQKMASTAEYDVPTTDGVHTITNTNQLLTDEDNGLYVFAGKTGYLHESKWNLVVKMMDSRSKPLIVVVLGCDSKSQSFAEAAHIADWLWEHYRWL